MRSGIWDSSVDFPQRRTPWMTTAMPSGRLVGRSASRVTRTPADFALGAYRRAIARSCSSSIAVSSSLGKEILSR